MDGRRSYYVRGAGSVELPTRRVLAVALGLAAVTLAVISVAVAVVDLRHLQERQMLARNGFAVDVTITGCVANASGTGITESGFVCRGRYRVKEVAYDEVIHGSGQDFPVGTNIRAITSATRPTELYSPDSIRTDLSYRSALILPTVLAGLVISALAGEFVLLRRAPIRRRSSGGKSVVGAMQNSASLQ